jgi:hypothetical protein
MCKKALLVGFTLLERIPELGMKNEDCVIFMRV